MDRSPALTRRPVSLLCAIAIIATLVAIGPPASAVNTAQNRIVNPDPANWTPNVLDGEVYTFVQIGTKIYAGGLFTQVQASSGGTVYSRSNLVSFDATTGAIDVNFNPTFDGAVKALAVAPDGNLLVGGFFTAVNGVTGINRLAKLNPASGARITAFSANANGQVWDIKVSGNRLFVGGRFTSIKNVARDKFAVVDTTSGAVDPNVSFTITDSRSTTVIPWVYSMDVSPDGSKVAIIGNFMKVNGESRPQAALLNVASVPAQLADWQTNRYEHPCFSNAFVTYMRDVDFSPDGSYFVIVATGGPNVGTLCDTAARWNTNATGSALEPAWVDVSGGDTLSAVAITGSVVYVGGHQRWMNNYYGSDFAGPGTVDRPGIAALDPINGMPFSWNPGRDRGKAVYGFLATNDGLWVGSDTDRIGGETHRKIAFFPLAGGKTPPPTDPYTLPGDLYNVPTSACQGLDPSILYRVNAGGPSVDPLDCGPVWAADDSDGAPGAAYRNGGSNSAGPWGQQFTVDGNVPATTPSTIFDTERWDPGDGDEMQWNFPVTTGTHLRVRLYLINQYPGTSQPTQRVFSVTIDGNTVLNNYDIVADVGDRVGTMKSFPITSDGNVDIDFSHFTENPLVNGIEIINPDVPPMPVGNINFLQRRAFDGTTPGNTSSLTTQGTDWSTTRGIFALQGTLYNGSTDGKFYARTFDGSSVGPAQQINLNGLTDFPVQNLSGMFYANGEIYYTVRGDTRMYHRYFTPESQLVGSYRFTVGTLSPAVDWSSVRGMTLANGKLYFARIDGNLYSMDFANGSPVGGTETLVSPKSAGYDWASNGLFAFTHVDVDTTAPTAPGKPTGSSPGTGTISINWAASQDASPPITYRVYRDTDLVNPITTTTSTSFTDTNLTPGSQHTYTVDAIDKFNNGPTVGPTSDPITVTSSIFADDFSSGDFSRWNAATRMTIDPGSGGVAPPSARAQTTNQSAFAYKDLSNTYSSICMSVNVNATTLDPTTSIVVLRLRTAANGPIARVYANSAGVLFVRSDASNVQKQASASLGTGWHSVELCGTVGTSGTWDLYRDGVKIVNAWAANTGTTPVGRVEIGKAESVSATVNYDDVVVDQAAG